MLFNTIEFLIFFCVFFGVYWSLKRRLTAQNVLLLAGSCIFYGWWDWRFLGLIMITALTTWGTALAGERSHRRAWMVTNIAINVGILIAFKYFNFFTENLVRLLAVFGWNVDWFTIDVLLPVGISFYTFQAISYSVDTYRGTISPTRNLLVFSTFLTFFPQLLAGPIERGQQLLPQISQPRQWSYRLAVDGAREVVWGLFKKVAVADMCGLYVDSIYGNPSSAPWKLSIASMLFLLQIYCDFSGYCNMARGLAAMLGIKLAVNFRYPLFARNVADFWHRWHITLMTWFRDYIYIPLGGSRQGRWRTYVNIMIVFGLSGLWHGASWNFIIWGVAWGVAMVIARIAGQQNYHPKSIPFSDPLTLARITGVVYLTTLIFVFFRLDNLQYAIDVIGSTWYYTAGAFVIVWACASIGHYVGWRIFTLGATVALLFVAMTWVTLGAGMALAFTVRGVFTASIVGVIAAEWWGRRKSFAIEHLVIDRWKRAAVYLILILGILLSNRTGQQFIYYQF